MEDVMTKGSLTHLINQWAELIVEQPQLHRVCLINIYLYLKLDPAGTVDHADTLGKTHFFVNSEILGFMFGGKKKNMN